MNAGNLKSKNAELLKNIKKEHSLFSNKLMKLQQEYSQFLKKYRAKLEDLKISELRKKIK